MNAKYFGNALDLFKFDLFTHLAQIESLEILYVGMITEPQPKEHDPKYLKYEVGSKNNLLKDFLQERYKTDTQVEVAEVAHYFQNTSIKFKVFSDSSNSVDFFKDEKRSDYFERVSSTIKSLQGRSLVYFDPDVGSDIGIIRRFRSNKELYIKGEELLRIRSQLRSSDCIGYFQHLGNTNYSVSQRIKDLKEYFGEWVIMVGYARIQASLVLILNDEQQYESKREIIKQYFKNYEDLRHKEKFIIA